MPTTSASTPPGLQQGGPASDDDARRLLHELQVHQAELSQQNEELLDARAELAASLHRYFQLYESAPVGLVTVDRRGVVQEINQQGRSLLAAAGQNLVGQSLLDCVDEASRGALWRAIAAPQEPAGGRGVDLAVSHPPTELRLLHAEIEPSPGAGDRMLLALTDVTALRRAQAELAHTREILELSNRIARIGYWEFDRQRDSMTWSAVAREIQALPADFDPSLESVVGRFKPGDSRERLRAAMTAALEHGTPFDLELQITTSRGQDIWVRKIGIAEMGGGRCQRLYGTFQDIDARVLAEGARLAQARAEAVNRSKSAFLSRMSHDLRTPLNAVMGFSQLLQLNEAVRRSPTASTQVQLIYNAGEHLLALVNDVLDLTRIEAGGLRLASDNVSVLPLLAECLSLTESLAQHHGIRMRVVGEDGGHQVVGDRARLRQALVNLLGNAVKFNRPQGSVEVGVAADAGRVAIAIRDTGVGLAPAQIAELFQPFNRLDAERSGVPGTGLGLVIARQLVQAMGGTITVQGSPGQGSVFTVTLPQAGAAHARPALAAAARHDAAPRPFLVLYVEDNPVNAELMRQVVAQHAGFRLEIATDGEAGLDAARTMHPDLVLLDMNLPLLDGAEVLRRLLDDPSLAHIPCVAVSANAMASDIQRALDAGFADYITKPFTIERVTTLLESFRAPALAGAAASRPAPTAERSLRGSGWR
jgi:hypothetical protein